MHAYLTIKVLKRNGIWSVLKILQVPKCRVYNKSLLLFDVYIHQLNFSDIAVYIFEKECNHPASLQLVLPQKTPLENLLTDKVLPHRNLAKADI